MAKSSVKELKIQEQVCQWIKYSYTKSIFTCDLSSGMKMTIGQSVKSTKMRSSRGLPDLMIFEPRGSYNGLFIELKKKDIKIFKKDGSLVSDSHIREQAEILTRLTMKGYKAVFACGFEEAIKIINDYMTLSK